MRVRTRFNNKKYILSVKTFLNPQVTLHWYMFIVKNKQEKSINILKSFRRFIVAINNSDVMFHVDTLVCIVFTHCVLVDVFT